MDGLKDPAPAASLPAAVGAGTSFSLAASLPGVGVDRTPPTGPSSSESPSLYGRSISGSLASSLAEVEGVGRASSSTSSSSSSGSSGDRSSVASGLAGLKRMSSSGSSSSSSEANVMRSADLADLMADMGLSQQEEKAGRQLEGGGGAATTSQALLSSGLSYSGEGVFGRPVAPTWRAADAVGGIPGASRRGGCGSGLDTPRNGSSSDGTLAYSSEGEASAPARDRVSLLGAPQPAFRPLPPSSSSFGGSSQQVRGATDTVRSEFIHTILNIPPILALPADRSFLPQQL